MRKTQSSKKKSKLQTSAKLKFFVVCWLVLIVDAFLVQQVKSSNYSPLPHQFTIESAPDQQTRIVENTPQNLQVIVKPKVTPTPDPVSSQQGNDDKQEDSKTTNNSVGAIGSGQENPGNIKVSNVVVSMLSDSQRNLWIGTEEAGLYLQKPSGDIKQFTTKDGLGDNFVYALCEDRQGRIWAGHIRSGVSVYDGQTWKKFDILHGPLGERVDDIACSPLDGDIWMATCLGLARYSEQHKLWKYYTRAEGLPADQFSCIDFLDDGTVLAGTQCDGLVNGSPTDEFKVWHTVTGDFDDADDFLKPAGVGLPSPLINDVLVTHDQNVYLATCRGLAKCELNDSKEETKNSLINKNLPGTLKKLLNINSWDYLRGRDYDDIARGRINSPPKNWQPIQTQAQSQNLIHEDFITCLAEDPTGLLYIGGRMRGLLIVNPKNNQRQHFPKPLPGENDQYLTAIAFNYQGQPVIGGYTHGHKTLKDLPEWATKRQKLKPTAKVNVTAITPKAHPQPATPPSDAELVKWINTLESKQEALPELWGTYLHDDWITQGDWVGRIGRQLAFLCAHDAPLDHQVSLGGSKYWFTGAIGPIKGEFDALRRWCHWESSDERRVLYNPIIGHRREAEWDDHGEAYPYFHEGPDVWVNVKIPEGIHRVALYFVNPNGHTTKNRFRDYLIEVKPFCKGDVSVAYKTRTLAKSRVSQFWGGGYKMFALKGPHNYWIKVGDNTSFNVIVCGIFVDRMFGPQDELEDWPLSGMGHVQYRPYPIDREHFKIKYQNQASTESLAFKVEDQLDSKWNINSVAETNRMYHLLSYRALSTTKEYNLQKNWHWRLRFWSSQYREEFAFTMVRSIASFKQLNPGTPIPSFGKFKFIREE